MAAAVRGRLVGQRPVPVSGLEKPLRALGKVRGPQRGEPDEARDRTLTQLLERTATHGESNSVLILGGRGHGKTAMLNEALRTVKAQCEGKGAPLVVAHLDGHVLTDDRAALYELARQLAVDTELQNRDFGSYAETLAFMLGTLRRADRATVPLILVLNEFDQFALHGKQTLLYNLFDIVQSRGSPMAVVGVTCRLDAIEMLEKRVKSRFSHRQVFVPPADTFNDYCQPLFSALTVTADELPDAQGRTAWNDAVHALADDADFREAVEPLFQLTKDVRALFQLAFAVVARIEMDGAQLTGAAFLATVMRGPADPKVAMLKGVSILELTLVVAMRQLRDQKSLPHFNFAMVYEEYRAFMAQQPQQSVDLFSKPVAMKAFEQLTATELVRAVASAHARAGGGAWTQSSSEPRSPWHIPAHAAGLREFVMVELQLEASQVIEAVRQRADCPVFLRKWTTQWIE